MTKRTIWTNEDAMRATGGRSTGLWMASGVSIDSRTVEVGDLFIAIPGENFDGHDFVKNAFDKGVAAAMVTHVPEGVAEDSPLLIVDDIMTALQDLAKFSRHRMKGRVICVTGSVGKTSVKEMLGVAFEGQGSVYLTQGNLNNHFGLPLSLARMPFDTDFGILEIGMNHPGEIIPLAKIANPDVAIITNVAAVHLEFFESVEAIADAKAEIFSGLNENGVAVLNFDNQYYEQLVEHAKSKGVEHIISFGENEGAGFRLISYTDKGSKAKIILNAEDKNIEYEIGVLGKHQAINSVGVLAVIRAVDGDILQAARSLARLEEKAGRGKIYDIAYQNKNLTIIDDCYNASPTSVAAALDKLGAMKVEGRKIAVLGDMFELGGDAIEFHKNISKNLRDNNIDLLFTAGDLMLNLYNEVADAMRGASAKTSAELAAMLAKLLKTGDAVLVKGSRGMKMEKIIDFLKGK